MGNKDAEKEFEIGDIVECGSIDGLMIVSGVIHDQLRLFVQGYFSSGREIEVDFDDVEKRWQKKDI